MASSKLLMRGIVILNEGLESRLQVVHDLEIPSVPEHHVLIKVKAFGVNRADLLQRSGRYPPPKGALSSLMGLEAAGVVVDSADPAFPSGTPVMALLPSGGYAEYCVAHARCTLPLPLGAEGGGEPPLAAFVRGAASMESYLTAYQALRNNGDPQRRVAHGGAPMTVLWHAGASALGLAGVQLLKLADAGNRALVTVGSAEKAARCVALGADEGINYKEEAFERVVAERTGGKGVDMVVDCVGAQYWQQNIAALRPEGTMVMLGFLGGAKVQEFDLSQLLRKKLTIVGSVLRDRTMEYKAELVQSFVAEFGAHLQSGRLAPLIDSVFDAERIQEAHDRVSSNLNTGKVVITW